MDDLIVVLIAAVVLFFLWRGLSSSASTTAPYTSSLITDVGTALKNVEGQIASLADSTSKQIGKLSVTVAKNAAQGAYDVSRSHSTTKISGKDLANANANDLTAGIKGGVTIPTTWEGILGAAAGSAPEDLAGSALQGIATGTEAVLKLPVTHDIEDAGKWVGKKVSGLAKWLGL
ncbi:hypothetical protein [Sulfobacillus sp. hq2]|uniref:hypothetical protein n=1 Tax=Sulfobacillus TaxID=28033 RepID=UPI000CD03D0B|nr:hypothetical protein [Sulfobacillus sp. hq2]POB11429.1 hypothetical protein CO251_04610 [Sulfobacillus sp. hq2]